LNELNLGQKVAITGFLATCAMGLGASALLYSAGTGRPSLTTLLSPETARLKHSASPLERALKTTMWEYVREPADIETVGRWIAAGSSRRGFYETVRPILKRDCWECHGRVGTRSGARPLEAYADVLPYAVTRGPPLKQLSLRAHAHLLGVGLVLLALTLLVNATSAPERLRVGVSAGLFLSLLGDVLGQYLAKLHGGFAYFTWLSGWGFVVSFVAALGLITRELWFKRRVAGS